MIPKMEEEPLVEFEDRKSRAGSTRSRTFGDVRGLVRHMWYRG
jgi:hypothetical protein